LQKLEKISFIDKNKTREGTYKIEFSLLEWQLLIK
jgi:hypothetical protein